jgi:Carbamoyl-phosphate synthetase large chain, oligomerisation domain
LRNALCSREISAGRPDAHHADEKRGRSGLDGDGNILPRDVISRKLSAPNAERIYFIRHALRAGFVIEEIFQLTKMDRWFGFKLRRLWILKENLQPLSVDRTLARHIS